jgi:dolichol-phosphate mannosyltransferase
MSLSIIIPCRNEEESIENTINEITYHLINTISDFEINLINDFSSDDTLEKLKIISKTNNKIKVYDNKIKGLGGAINLGIEKSLKKFTIIVMADLSDSPEDIIKYYFEIKNNDLDAVLGTRFSSNSTIVNYPKKKLFFNRVFNNLVKILYLQKYNDFTNAFKIYKTSVLKELKPIVSENFNVFLELPLKIISRKYKYSIISINWKNRKIGVAKFKIKELGSKYLFTLFYCFLEKILLDKKVKK